jgi:hypothetical protein
MAVVGVACALPVILLLNRTGPSHQRRRDICRRRAHRRRAHKPLRPLLADLEAYRLAGADTKAATAARVDAFLPRRARSTARAAWLRFRANG